MGRHPQPTRLQPQLNRPTKEANNIMAKWMPESPAELQRLWLIDRLRELQIREGDILLSQYKELENLQEDLGEVKTRMNELMRLTTMASEEFGALMILFQELLG